MAMANIKQPLLFSGEKGEMHLYVLFDTNVKLSCISSDFIRDFGRAQRLGRPRIMTTSEGIPFEIREIIKLNFILDDKEFSEEFLVIPNMVEEVIFGSTTISNLKIKLLEEKGVATL